MILFIIYNIIVTVLFIFLFIFYNRICCLKKDLFVNACKNEYIHNCEGILELNEQLKEENKKLKSTISYLQDKHIIIKNEIILQNKLVDENYNLKKEIAVLQKEKKCIADKIDLLISKKEFQLQIMPDCEIKGDTNDIIK